MLAILPSCPAPAYRKPPDRYIHTELAQRKRYQLVIGASEFMLDKDKDLNRDFVARTASLVSARLAEVGYGPLPSLAGSPDKAITGAHATKQRVTDAIKEMARVMGDTDIGLIYYIGHGTITPSNVDLALAVYDKPVSEDEGIRYSDIVGILTLLKRRARVEQIPKIILIVETCYSGTVIGVPGPVIVDNDGLQRLARVTNGVVPPRQMVIVTATLGGDSPRAFPLEGTQLSAFGFFFARGLREDWACVDRKADGVITVHELFRYLDERLESAAKASLVPERMKPLKRDEEQFSFIAYDSAKYANEGDLADILDLVVTSPPNSIAELVFPDGSVQKCTPSCRMAVSKDVVNEVTFVTRPRLDISTETMKRGGALGVEILEKGPVERSLSTLLPPGGKGRHVFASGAVIEIK